MLNLFSLQWFSTPLLSFTSPIMKSSRAPFFQLTGRENRNLSSQDNVLILLQGSFHQSGIFQILCSRIFISSNQNPGLRKQFTLISLKRNKHFQLQASTSRGNPGILFPFSPYCLSLLWKNNIKSIVQKSLLNCSVATFPSSS